VHLDIDMLLADHPVDVPSGSIDGDPCTAPLLDNIVEGWLAPLTEWISRQGVPPWSGSGDLPGG
jgi:hypothetical protein